MLPVVSECLCASVCALACLCVCVCERERVTERLSASEWVCLHVCTGRFVSIHMLVCVCARTRVCVSVWRSASDGMRRMGGVTLLHTLGCSARSFPLCHAPARLLAWRRGPFTPEHRPSPPSLTALRYPSMCIVLSVSARAASSMLNDLCVPLS